ncbi:MAG: glycosyltransferase [Calothrix sp. C42_A2020_038]|nr:glycosyltransferase [Calothrix sp. C42_A2020_038]
MSNQACRILFVAYGSMATEGGYKTRVISEIESIVKVNSNINLSLVCFDEVKNLRSKQDAYDLLKNKLDSLGVKLTCYGIPSFKALWILKLITGFYISLIILLEAIKGKVQIIHAQNHVVGLYTLFTKIITKKCVVLDVHGVRFAERIYKKRKRLEEYLWLDVIANYLEVWILKKYDGLIFVSEAMAKFYNCTDKTRYKVVPCCVNTNKFKIFEKSEVLLKSRLDISERFIVTYSGTFFTIWQEPDDILQIFKEIKSKITNAYLLILSGDDCEKIKQFIFSKGILEKDFAVYKLKHDLVPQWLSISNLGLLIRRPSVVNYAASPTKFGEYLSCGVPVIISENVGDFSQLVSELQIGLIAQDNNGKITLNYSDLQKISLIEKDIISSHCRKVAIDFLDWSNHSLSIVNLYQSIINS